jgi:hypothetical protein
MHAKFELLHLKSDEMLVQIKYQRHKNKIKCPLLCFVCDKINIKAAGSHALSIEENLTCNVMNLPPSMKKAGVAALVVEDEIFTRLMGRPSIELPIEMT